MQRKHLTVRKQLPLLDLENPANVSALRRIMVAMEGLEAARAALAGTGGIETIPRVSEDEIA